MPKEDIKNRIMPEQEFLCAITSARLPDDPSMVDVDRVIERFKGGTYTDENTRVVMPRAHMERHGILRERDGWLETLKAYMDDRQQTMKLLMKTENQLRAYARRTDHLNPETEDFLSAMAEPVRDRLASVDKEVKRLINKSDDPLVNSAMGVVGLGEIGIAGLTIYIDLEKADSPSALWKYTGLHAASHERYTKGETSGGNKTLRTILWNTANSMTKNRKCPYRDVYDDVKRRLAESDKVTKTRNTQGRLVELPWKDTKPSHRHGAALRAIMKHLLADYWRVGREIKGLSVRPLYAEQHLGHDGIIDPRERGWAF